VTRKQTGLLRLARVAVTFVCAYALALTVILSGWTANSHAAGAGFSVICSEHTVAADAPPPGGDGRHHALCAMLCSLQAGSLDAAPLPAGIGVRRPLLLVAGGLSLIQPIDPRSYFPKDHQVRGPPPPIAA
jgi:hypothetical protein